MNNVNAQCCNEEKYLKYRMFDMSWVEVKEWLEKTDTVIVPVGSIEQHGPALPGTDRGREKSTVVHFGKLRGTGDYDERCDRAVRVPVPVTGF